MVRKESSNGWPETQEYQNLWIRVMRWEYQFSINMSQFMQDERQRLYDRYFRFEGFIGDNSKVLPGALGDSYGPQVSSL